LGAWTQYHAHRTERRLRRAKTAVSSSDAFAPIDIDVQIAL
jgi:hypothetical protein